MMLYKVVVKRIDIHLECQNNLFYDISLQIYYIWCFFFICDLDLFFTAYLRQKRHIITHKISRCLSMK